MEEYQGLVFGSNAVLKAEQILARAVLIKHVFYPE
jgi:hypothetical protein